VYGAPLFPVSFATCWLVTLDCDGTVRLPLDVIIPTFGLRRFSDVVPSFDGVLSNYFREFLAKELYGAPLYFIRAVLVGCWIVTGSLGLPP
jgi:hypothetical protein